MSRSGPSIEIQEITGSGTYDFHIDLEEVTSIQIHANYGATGTLASSAFVLTLSNHPEAISGAPNKGVLPVWSSQADVTLTAITTGEQDELVNMGNLGAKWAKISVTYSSGSGEIAILSNRA